MRWMRMPSRPPEPERAASRALLFPDDRLHPLIIDRLSAIAFVSDEDGRILDANAGFRRVVGDTCRVAPVLANPRFGDLVAVLPAPSDEPAFTGVITLLRPSGGTQSFHGIVFRLPAGIACLAEYDPNEHERLAAAVLALNDDLVTRQRALVRAQRDAEAERARQAALVRQLSDAREQVLQAERLATVGRLAAGIAHEINNPLAAAISGVGALESYAHDLLRLVAAPSPEAVPVARTDAAWLEEDVPNVVSEIRAALNRVRQIVDALRDLARPGEPTAQMVSPTQLLGDAVELMSDRLRTVHLEMAATSLPPVECVVPEIGQVLLALLDNALAAVGPGGTISLTGGEDAEGVWIDVRDDGCGIAEKDRPHLFDPFFTTRPIGAGAGLGLYLAWNIVRRHGGRIDVDSTPGQGSQFTVHLPWRIRPPRPQRLPGP
jgi:signal transduction histidine kinase